MSLDLKILKGLSLDKLQAVDFAASYNQDLFGTEYQLFSRLFLAYTKGYRQPPTHRVLKEWAGEQAYGDVIDKIWGEIDSVEYDVREYPYDLDLLKKRYMAAALNEIKDVIGSKGTEDPNALVKSISLKLQNINTIQSGKTYTQKTLKEHVDDFEEELMAVIDNPTENSLSIPTGYSCIDHAIGGLKPADMILVGGESGSGKSTLLFNLMLQVWLQKNTIDTPAGEFAKGYNVIYYSLEMPYKECFNRLLSRLAQVPERSITDGVLNTEQRKRILKAEQFIKNYPYEFDIVDIAAGVNIEQLELRYNDALLKYKPDVCAVDYLGIMSGGEQTEADWLKISELAKQLHEFGRIYNVPVATAVQLTDIQRGSNSDPKSKSVHQIVGPHRIGRSSLILHHATLYIQIESKPGDETSTFMNYHLVKNRRGPKMLMGTLNKNFEVCTLSDIEYIPKIKTGKTDTSDEGGKLIDLSNQLNTSNQDFKEKMNRIRNGLNNK